jgi:hypothetical protein
VGGLLGRSGGETINNCFWDIQASGQSSSAGGEGKTTAQMKKSATYIAAGWDFVNTWQISQYQTYPYFRVNPSADLNYDGVVNMADFAIMASQWLTGEVVATELAM